MRSLRARRFEGLAQSEIRRMTIECDRAGGINLAQGLCDLPVPEPVRRAAVEALGQPTNTYSKAAGILELRQALARKLRRDNAIEADPDREIVVSAGVTGAYFCTLHALLDPGDGILLLEPYYGYHRNIARVEGLRCHTLRLGPPHAALEESALRTAVTDDARALVLCTPSNPAGKCLTREELEGVARVAEERDLLVITDEIYEYFCYDGREHVSPASLPELRPRTVSLFGHSKTFAITGWRIGCAVAPEALASRILLANDLSFICAARPFQHAVATAVDGLEPEWYAALAASFQRKRDRICEALAKAGFEPLCPEGAYYVLAGLGSFEYPSARGAALDLLQQSGVAAVPGTAFHDGPEGERCLRFCFAKQDAVLDEACARLVAFRPAGPGRA